MHWNIVYQIGHTTVPKKKELLFQFNRVTQGVSQPTPLNIDCANRVNNFLGFAVSYKYVASYSNPTTKKEAIILE